MDHSNSSRVLYRYQLKNSSSLKASDGIIVLEATSPSQTRLTEIDFFDADYGILKVLAPGKIWSDSIHDIYISDMAVKLKAEHNDWSYESIAKQAKESAEHFPFEEVIEKRSPFKPLP
jgi:hypothetical protein